MKITKQELVNIIKEEVEKALEGKGGDDELTEQLELVQRGLNQLNMFLADMSREKYSSDIKDETRARDFERYLEILREIDSGLSQEFKVFVRKLTGAKDGTLLSKRRGLNRR